MMQPIRQNSTDKVSIGPAVDLDGFTLNTALLLSTADSAAVKLGDDSVVDISGYTWAATTSMDGEFDLTLQTGISDTIGAFTLLIEDVSLILPIREKFYVYDPVVFDALFAASPTLLTSRDIGQLYEAKVSTVNSTTSFDMDVAIITDDNWIGQIVTIQDATDGQTVAHWVADVDQVNDRLILDSAPVFTVAVGDTFRVESRIHPTFALQAYDPPTRQELTDDILSVLVQNRGFFRLTCRSDAAPAIDDAVELADLNKDDGAGLGSYDNTKDSLEAGVTKIDGKDLKEGGAGGQEIGAV